MLKNNLIFILIIYLKYYENKTSNIKILIIDILILLMNWNIITLELNKFKI